MSAKNDERGVICHFRRVFFIRRKFKAAKEEEKEVLAEGR